MEVQVVYFCILGDWYTYIEVQVVYYCILGDWHTYDMEVQVVLEESWSKGEQTMDISSYFPGCPYIINFCNLTQVCHSEASSKLKRNPCPLANSMINTHFCVPTVY